MAGSIGRVAGGPMNTSWIIALVQGRKPGRFRFNGFLRPEASFLKPNCNPYIPPGCDDHRRPAGDGCSDRQADRYPGGRLGRDVKVLGVWEFRFYAFGVKVFGAKLFGCRHVRAKGLGFRVQGLSLGCRAWSSVLMVWG